MFFGIDARRVREPAHGIDDIFVERWSPRAMAGEPMDAGELMTLLEAARWAPSAMNEQPWRFLYARTDEEAWPVFLGLLVEGNRVWARRAAALLVVLSKRTFTRNGRPSPTHSFDAGAAWQNLALQGASRGLVVHGMGGFDPDRARTELGIPDDYAVEAMVAVGRPGNPAELPEPLRERETPSLRKPLARIAFEGRFPEEGEG